VYLFYDPVKCVFSSYFLDSAHFHYSNNITVVSNIRFLYIVLLNIQNYLTYILQCFVLGSRSIINIHQTVSLFGSVSICIRVKASYLKPVTPVGAVYLESVH
jgi:hypothetical protein